MRDIAALLVLGGACALLYWVYVVYWNYVVLALAGLAGLFVVWVTYGLYRRYGRLIFGGVPFAMGGQNIVDYAWKMFPAGNLVDFLALPVGVYRHSREADRIFGNMTKHLEYIRDALFNPSNPAYATVDIGKLPYGVRVALLPDLLGLSGKGWRYQLDFCSSAGESSRGEELSLYYRAFGQSPVLEQWHKRRADIWSLVGEKVRYNTGEDGTGVFLFEMGVDAWSPYDDDFREMGYDFPWRLHPWEPPIMQQRALEAAAQFAEPPSEEQEFVAPDAVLPFVDASASKGGHLWLGYIFLGTNIRDGKPYWKRISQFQHHLIVGIAGYGKSVFLNQMLQGVRYNLMAFEKVYLVDLKGGVELVEYEDYGEQFKVVYRYEELHELVAGLVQTMNSRLEWMRENRVKKWTGKRILFVVDEYAQIALQTPQGKEEKEAHTRLLANLNKISMLGRAPGVLLWVQLQKATTDVMDSSFRNNLQAQVCFRVASRLAAASLFGEAKDLELDPTRLRRGQCIYYDDATGETVYLQAHMRIEEKEAA